MAKISRWYTKDTVIEVNQSQAADIIYSSPTSNEIVEQISNVWFSGESEEYYHINLSFPINNDNSTISVLKDGKFNPEEKFSNSNFIQSLSEAATKSYIQNALPKNTREYILSALSQTSDPTENQQKAIDIYNTLVNNSFVTQRFFIDTGKKKSGSLIYFQCLVLLKEQDIESMADLAGDISQTVENLTNVGPFNLFDNIGYYQNNVSSQGNISYDHFRSAIRSIEICQELNVKEDSRGKYLVEFSALGSQLKDLYSKIANMIPEEGLSDVNNKQISLKDINIVYYLNYISDSDGEPTRIEFTSLVLSLASNAQNKYFGAEDVLSIAEGHAYVGFIQDTYSDNLLNLLANISKIDSYFKKTKKSNFDLDFFVKEFIFRYKERAKIEQSSRIYNDGTSRYKTKEEVELERTGLSPAQKKEIFKEVRQKSIQTADQAFLNIIKNNKKIKTPKEIYDLVLNVIPLMELISTAASCINKYIDNTPARRVCRTIIRNLNLQQIDQLLFYINTSTSNEVNRLRDLLIENSIDTKDRESFKNYLIFLADSQTSEDDFLCIVIFAALPAAIALLSTFGKDEVERFLGSVRDRLQGEVEQQVENATRFLEEELINPAADILNSIEQSLANHPFLSFTGDWKKQISLLIAKIITDTITELMLLLIQEIAYICEGSSKADFANMRSLSSGNPDVNYPNLSGPVVPFDLNNVGIQTLVDDESAYEDIKDFLDSFGTGDSEISSDLIQSFIESMTDILTLSEICTLLGEDSSELNYDVVINKVWNGLLSLEKFSIIKERLNTKRNLDLLFSILANKVDKSVCIQKLQDLENTKKILSEICEPVSNDALIEDLKDKATDAAIQSLLNQEDSIIDDLLDAISKLQNPEQPVVFCGPEAEERGVEPLLPTLQHPSMVYLDQQFLKSSLSASVALFESNLDSFKSVILNLEGISSPSDILSNINSASSNVVGAMASAYGLDLNNTGYKKQSSADLNIKIQNNAVVANGVNQELLMLSGLDIIDSNQEEQTISFGIDFSNNPDDIIDDRLLLNFNFSDTSQTTFQDVELPPKSVELLVQNQTVGVGRRYTTPLNDNSYSNIKNILNTFTGESSFDDKVKQNLLDNIDFYATINSQVIKEHAEYITTQDLFKTVNFNKLKLTRANLCEQSIFIIQDIIEEAVTNVQSIECKFGLGVLPSARELGQIYALLEAYIRVITISEMLKSFFVFASFSIDAMLPAQTDSDESSFYFQYLIDQIVDRIGSDQQNSIISSAQGYLAVAYAAINNVELESLQQLTVLENIVGKSINVVQAKFREKLEKAGYNSNIGEFVDEYTKNTPYTQVYSNLDAGSSFSTDEPFAYTPFITENVDLTNGFFRIGGYSYSGLPRLINGGFFTERGVDIRRIYEGDEQSTYTQDLHQLILDELDSKETSAFQATLAFAALQGDQVQIGEIPLGWSLPEGKPGPSNKIYYNLKEVYELNIKQGALRDLFGTRTIGGQTRSAFQIPKSLLSQTSDDLTALANQEGLLANPPFDVDSMVNSIDQWKSFLKSYLDEDGEAYLALIDNTNDFRSNTFFKRFNDYATYNLLIRVDGNPLLSSLYESAKTKMNLPTFEGGEFKRNFIQASVFDKKYFIKQQGQEGDIIYFKLPLLYFSKNFNSGGTTPVASPDGPPSLPASAPSGQEFSSFLMNTYIEQLKFDQSGGTLRDIISQSSGFKSFVDNMQYKNVLSFVSILVTELIQKGYPLVNNVFDSSLASIRSDVEQLINIANRESNPEFYQNFPAQQLSNPLQQYNLDLVSLFLTALLKGLANTVDPTWVTPWFLPGPLTPIGIVAKILDGSSDSNPAANQKSIGDAISNDLACEDEQNQNG